MECEEWGEIWQETFPTASAHADGGHDLLDLGVLAGFLDFVLNEEAGLEDEHEDGGGSDLGEEEGGTCGQGGEEDDGLHDKAANDGDGDEADDEVDEGVHGGEVVEWLEGVPATGTLPHSRQRDGRAASSPSQRESGVRS